MKKLFLAVSTAIVTSFLMKIYRKLREEPEEPESKEEVYRHMKAAHEAHREIERLRAAARPTIAKMDAISTPRDGDFMAAIGSTQQMAPGRFA